MLIVIMEKQHSGDDHPREGDDPAAAELARLRKEAREVATEARTMAERQTKLLARLHALEEKIEAHRRFLEDERGKR